MTETWSRADLHIHSCHSDGLAQVSQILDWAQENTDLRVVAITDHNTIEGALFAKSIESMYDIEVIVGEEISTRSGHVIGLFLESPIPAGLTVAETFARIQEQDGVVVIPHPFSPRGIFGPQGTGDFVYALNDLAFHALEVYNSLPYLVYANRLAARMFTGGQGIAATGGSDAHVLDAIGKGATLFRGTTAEDLRRSIDALETRADAGPGSTLNMALRYAFRLPQIRRQQALNHETCRPVAGLR